MIPKQEIMALAAELQLQSHLTRASSRSTPIPGVRNRGKVGSAIAARWAEQVTHPASSWTS